ncbi:hypothetical protein ACF0H5_004240 [Mactra antiquata]
MDNTTDVYNVTVKELPRAPPALLPDWPKCETIPDPIAPGAVSKAKDWIASTVPPVLIVLGVFGNILTILTLVRSIKGKITSTTLYLLLLAISDLLLLLNGPLRQWIRLAWKYDFRTYHVMVCKLAVWLTYGTMQFSSWILVVLTMERMASVLWPHKVRTSCITRSSRIVSIILFVCIFGLNSHFLYGLGDTKLPYYSVKSCMPLYEEYSFFFLHVWHWINFVMAFAAPFVILAVGNFVIIAKIKQSYSTRKRMSLKGSAESSREKRTITRVMILLNVVFFVSQTPMSIYFIYIPYRIDEVNQMACDNYPEYVRQAELIWLIYTVVNMLGYINATVNFVLYVISGAKFRAEIKALLLCRKSPSTGGLFESRSSTTQPRSVRSRAGRSCETPSQQVKTVC